MKVLKHPIQGGGGHIWGIVHDLSVVKPWPQRLRPVHVLTFLAQTLVQTGRPRLVNLCLALENKLFAVRYLHTELRCAFSDVAHPFYNFEHVREYDDQQRAVCVLEAYLNGIYTALEVAALMNCSLHRELKLPQTFRKQAAKFDLFSFERWPWLKSFYDIRSELEHRGTSLPMLWRNSLILNFTRERRLNAFEKDGRYEVPLAHILGYGTELFDTFDSWAREELSRVDPDTLLDRSRAISPQTPLKNEKVKAGEILALLQPQVSTRTDSWT
jgi:hypothetical protein